MDPTTTLFTFMLQTSPYIHSVSLIGSWDNFSVRYPLEKDSRRATGQWRGCWAFKDIICDGVDTNETKRDGGLRMGQDYWYYYELDGGTEIHDSTLPSTTSCPFLPGQPVNILAVPEDRGTCRDRSASMGEMIGEPQTQSPMDRFEKPRAVPEVLRSTRLNTSPSVTQSPPRSSRSTSPLRKSPWSARAMFGLRPRRSTTSGEENDQASPYPTAWYARPLMSRSPERTRPITSSRTSRSSSHNSLRDDPSSYGTASSRPTTPITQARRFPATSVARDSSPAPSGFISFINPLPHVPVSCDVSEEELSALSDDEDDMNFAMASMDDSSKRASSGGLCPRPRSFNKAPDSAGARVGTSDMKPLPMVPFETARNNVVREGRSLARMDTQLSMPNRMASPADCTWNELVSPTDSNISYSLSVYDSAPDDEDCVSEGGQSQLGWTGYSLPIEEAGSEMTLKNEVVQRTFENPFLTMPVLDQTVVAGPADEWMNEMGYLSQVILGK